MMGHSKGIVGPKIGAAEHKAGLGNRAHSVAIDHKRAQR